jgi:hypothetical protein
MTEKYFGIRINLKATLGGQTTIVGKYTSEMGNVSIDVSIGDFSQSKKALLIKKLAARKPKITMRIQNSWLSLFLVADVWAKPWIFEDSKNS